MPSTPASTCKVPVELRVRTERDRLRGKLRMRFGGGRLPQLIKGCSKSAATNDGFWSVHYVGRLLYLQRIHDCR